MASFADILGGLGDAISVGAGGDPRYQLEKQKKAWGQAVTAFDSDPTSGLAAMAQIDPKQATDFFKNWQDNQIKRGQLEHQGKELEIKGRTAQDEYDGVSYNRVLQIMRSASPETWGPMRERALALAKARNFSLPFDIPEKPEDGWADRITNAALDPKDAVASADRRAGIDIQAQNAATAAARADTDRRYKNARVAIDTGKLKVDAINKGGALQQTAAKTGVAAANVRKPSGRGSGLISSAPIVAPPGNPRPGQRVRSKTNPSVVFYEKDGKWVRD